MLRDKFNKYNMVLNYYYIEYTFTKAKFIRCEIKVKSSPFDFMFVI